MSVSKALNSYCKQIVVKYPNGLGVIFRSNSVLRHVLALSKMTNQIKFHCIELSEKLGSSRRVVKQNIIVITFFSSGAL